jgi:hypothetical protein
MLLGLELELAEDIGAIDALAFRFQVDPELLADVLRRPDQNELDAFEVEERRRVRIDKTPAPESLLKLFRKINL